MFGPKFGRDIYRHARGKSQVDHLTVDALRVQVDFDAAPSLDDPVEYGSPKIVAAFGDAAFAMDPEGHATDRRATPEEDGKRFAAIGTVRLGSETLNNVVCVGAIDPLVGMGPKTELK